MSRRPAAHRPTAAERRAAAARPLPPSLAVYATVTLTDGTARAVRIWDRPPTWWHKAQADQRDTWIRAYFARATGAEPGAIAAATVRAY